MVTGVNGEAGRMGGDEIAKEVIEAANVNQRILLEEYAESVMGFISKCVEDVTVIKNITTRANQKPWLTREECADKLVYILTDIYNTSLSQAIVPQCFKATTNAPLPNKTPALTLNDYRPVALTPIMMKCFERHNVKTSCNARPTPVSRPP
ncbi:hypothetical protein P4O66_002371 [Electrophorus voltai]|uniref:Uncharacterized protein n=1 Tax=Electrophorus voltai TaxID=2609070 RepID=A0AAD8YZX7_9TELE|nr:hypothetical protein P4O66_002371 [Electrophorus voltai]